jgi:hypothetical protein
VDISDSSHPQLRDSINPVGVAEWDPYVPHSPGYGYLADDYGGLVTLDMHDVDSISEEWAGYNASMAVDVFVDGTRAYVADLRAGLRILDVHDPSFPQTLGEYEGIGPLDVRSAVAKDSFAFITWGGDNRRFMRVLDVTDPTAPVFAAEESCMNPPEKLVLRDSLLYAAEVNEFRIFNVARPRQPLRMGSCASTDGVYFGLAVQDSLAYVAGGASLQIVDVSDAANPHVVGNSGRASTGVAVRDTFVYIPYPYDTLLVYSAADPTQLRLLSATPAGVWPWDVALGESRAYVGAEYGIDVYDLDNPAQPIHRGSVSVPYGVTRLSYSRGLLYAALWEGGMAMYETTAVGVAESKQTTPSPRVRLSAAPNPVCGQLILAGIPEGARVRVYDATGRIADVRAKESEGGVIELDLGRMRAGVYFVEVGDDARTAVLRIVKP